MPDSRSATAPAITAAGDGVSVGRRFTAAGVSPFDAIGWEIRDALIGDPESPAFEQRGVEFPKTWSQNATNIVAQKYFRGRMDSPERENSVKQMIGRVAGTIAEWGREGGYFATEDDAEAFNDELTHILLHQMAAFNSPVWFNVGFEEHPQCSACFILSRRGHDRVDPRLEHQGGHDLPRRLRLRDQPLPHPRLEGAPLEGRARLRPRQLHARRRRVGRHDQVGRQDASRGQDGRARRGPPGHPRLHLVQGARGGEGDGPARRGLRHAPRLGGVRLDPVPEREQLGAGHGRVHGARRARRLVGAEGARGRRRERDRRREGRAEPARRRRLALRRSGRPVRHDHQRVAHLPELGPDQRVEPVLGVHARGRLGLQPRLAQPHEVPARGRHVRRRGVRARGGRRDPRAGDRGRPVELPDRRHRQERTRVPPARHGLREPRRAADGERPRLRLRRGPRDLRRDHRADDRPRLPHLGRGGRGARGLRALRGEPRPAQPRDAQAPSRGVRDRRLAGHRLRAAGSRAACVGRGRGRRRPATATATPRPPCSHPRGRSRS